MITQWCIFSLDLWIMGQSICLLSVDLWTYQHSAFPSHSELIYTLSGTKKHSSAVSNVNLSVLSEITLHSPIVPRYLIWPITAKWNLTRLSSSRQSGSCFHTGHSMVVSDYFYFFLRQRKTRTGHFLNCDSQIVFLFLTRVANLRYKLNLILLMLLAMAVFHSR